MNTRILLAGIVGGVVMFIWNFVAHDFLPLGYMGVKTMSNEDAVRSALDTNLGDNPGLYIFPSGGWTPGMNADQTKEVMKKVAEQTAQGAAGIMIYRPKRVFNFPKRLIIQFATDFAEALLAAFLLAQTRIAGFGGRVGFVLIAGILAAITTNIPYANWYGFPKDYTSGQLMIVTIGFLLVGLVLALIVKPKIESAA